MTLITVQDGKVVLRDGKVGTEQACCCELPCSCLQYSNEVLVDPACGIDYIAFDVELFFPECTNNVLQDTVVLSDTAGLNSGLAVLSVHDPDANCDYDVLANLFCGSFTNQFGTFSSRWSVNVFVLAGTCCGGLLCAGFSGFSPHFPIGTNTEENVCCPAAITGELTATEVQDGFQPCPGWYIKISNMTVVLL